MANEQRGDLLRLSPMIRERVEGLLYDYKTFDSQIKICEAEISIPIPMATTSVVKFSSGDKNVSDSQPERYVLRLEDRKKLKYHKQLEWLKAHKFAIEEALKYADKRELKIFELKYMQNKQHKEVAFEIGMSEFGYRKVRDKFLKKMAQHLGY